MIQFNLLPDVKLEYMKTRRTKRTVVTVASIVAMISLAALILLFFVVNVLQQQHLKHLNSDIKADISKLQSIPDLDKVLTIQNQLGNLPALHDKKPVSSRAFSYLSQLTPTTATISDAKVNFDTNSMSVEGNADTLTTINKYVDTIKFTDYTPEGSTDKKKAFSEVVLTQFTKTDKGLTYKIDFKFDPTIYSNAAEVKLNVPSIISTRSTTEKPSELFQQIQTNKQGQ